MAIAQTVNNMAAPIRFVYNFSTVYLNEINRYNIFNKYHAFCKHTNIISREYSARHVDSFQYCLNSVRKYDYENYLCSLLLPESIRSAAFVIRAFNIEISQVRDLVSNPTIGEMRLSFWHNTLNLTFDGNPPDQPIARELAKVLQKHKLSKAWFQRLITSRESILNDKPFLTIKELEAYCDSSVVSIYLLILQALGVANVHYDHVASHIGKSQGICNLLRAVPYNASKRRVFLPLELMSKYKISHQELIYGDQKEGLHDAVYELSTVAHQHLLMARKLNKDVENYAKPVFLPAVAIAAYLNNLEKTNFDVFHPKNQKRNNWLPVALLSHRLRKKY